MQKGVNEIQIDQKNDHAVAQKSILNVTGQFWLFLQATFDLFTEIKCLKTLN